MKILLIEDDVWCVDILTIRLRSLGCQVLVGRTAAEGLAIARAERPELIFADLKLDNELSAGCEMMHALKQHPATACIPVVVTSAYVYRAEEMLECLPPVEGHLPKPFTFAQLKAIVTRFQAAPAA